MRRDLPFVLLSLLLLSFGSALAAEPAREPTLIAKPEAFQTLTAGHPLFHCSHCLVEARKGWLKEPREITDIAEGPIPDQPDEAVRDVLARLSFGPEGKPGPDPLPNYNSGYEYNNQPRRHEAASKAFAFARKFPDPQLLVHAAYRLLPLKSDWDPHRIKFPIAAWENCGWVSPEWRPHMLAAASYFFIGADALDTDLAKQVREALPRCS